jgi:non-heme chloroperoxidase
MCIRFMLSLLTLFLIAPSAAANPKAVKLKSDVTVHYTETGLKDAPALIALHGLGDTRRSWSLISGELAKTHRVYALDQRGHGAASSPVCCYSTADLAYDVILFMDAMDIDRATIVGHSMGSFVAQHLAIYYPQRVDKLVLLGTADTASKTEAIQWLWSSASRFERTATPDFIDQWQDNPTPVEPRFLEKVKAETADVRVHVWRGVASALMTEDHSGFLRDVQAPTLILWGEKDAAFSSVEQERLQRAMPQAMFKKYPRVGHNLHWEIPLQIGTDIRSFLDERTRDVGAGGRDESK